jgi:ferredoxin
MNELHIDIDRELCLGAQNCKHIAPAVFAIDDEGLATVISHDAVHHDAVAAAVESCPAGAIALRAARPDRPS